MRESVDRDSEGLQTVAERSIVEHALVAGLFDWVREGQIRTIIRDESGIIGDETLDAFTIGVVTILISEGYMKPTNVW